MFLQQNEGMEPAAESHNSKKLYLSKIHCEAIQYIKELYSEVTVSSHLQRYPMGKTQDHFTQNMVQVL